MENTNDFTNHAEKEDKKIEKSGTLARIDCSCGFCKEPVKSKDKFCPSCGANLLLDDEYDSLGHYGREYYLSRI